MYGELLCTIPVAGVFGHLAVIFILWNDVERLPPRTLAVLAAQQSLIVHAHLDRSFVQTLEFLHFAAATGDYHDGRISSRMNWIGWFEIVATNGHMRTSVLIEQTLFTFLKWDAKPETEIVDVLANMIIRNKTDGLFEDGFLKEHEDPFGSS